MLFRIDTRSSTPLYEQIIYQVKSMCSTGLLQPGEKLPSIRELSSHMVVNPNTVSKAYQELERLGIIVTVQGKGTFTAEDMPPAASPEEQLNLQRELKQLIVDCRFAGISRKQVEEWMEEAFKEMGDTSG